MTQWTHERVLARIGFGLKALVVSSGRVGPKGYGSPWPETVRALPPLAELGQWLELRREFEAREHARSDRPSAEEIALADEALQWPVRYLGDRPLPRDAIWLTALCSGLGLKLEKLLRRRRALADAMVAERSRSTPDIVRIYEDDAFDAAAKVARWANAAIGAGISFSERENRARVARIRQGARTLFAREIRRVHAIERITVVNRADVMPGKLFSQSRVHHFRIVAVAAIAAGLEQDGIEAR